MSSPIPAESRRRIAIVDDDASLVESLCDLLADDFYSIEIAAEGARARKILSDPGIRVVLLDVRLAGENGFTLMNQVRSRRGDLMFVVMTAHAEVESAVEALRHGAHDYLRKPFHPEELLASLNRCFDRLRLQEERERAEEQLKMQSRVLESMSEGVHLSDDTGTILYANPALEAMLGYSAGELVGSSAAALCADESEAGQPFSAVSHQRAWIGELASRKKDGSRLATRAQVFAFDMGGEEVWVTLREDVSERQKLEERLRHSQRLESVGTLAGGVAHDFNNILTTILGNAELGLSKLSPGDPNHREFLEILKAGSSASDLTDQLLTFSRRRTSKKTALDLNDTIRDLVRMLERILGADVLLTLRLNAHPATILADAGHMQQVLLNLCTNARQAMPEGGELVIETRNILIGSRTVASLPGAPAQGVQLVVTDTGRGIEPDHLAHVFEPFFTTKGPGEGTGLGLAVTHGIVTQHDGDIEVESGVGRGTAVTITLPVLTTAEVSTPELEDAFAPGAGETLLLVEDDAAVLEVGSRMLNGLSYRVVTARNSEEAVAVFETEKSRIDLAVIDLVMPGEGGVEVYEKLLAAKSGLPVLFVTGYDVDRRGESFGRLNRSSQVDFLQKPYTQRTIGEKIRSLLDSARAVADPPR